MKPINLVARLLPALTLIGIITTLALFWTTPETRDGVFYYFLFLLIYASIMLFFSDLIFMSGSKRLTAKVPYVAISAVHIVYALLVLLLRFILTLVPDIYFILATIAATCVQITLSFAVFRGVQYADAQQETMNQESNMKLSREVLLMDLTTKFRNNTTLAQDTEASRKLDALNNLWKSSSGKDNATSVQWTDNINTCIQILTQNISTGEANAGSVVDEMTRIISLIDQRNKLLQAK